MIENVFLLFFSILAALFVLSKFIIPNIRLWNVAGLANSTNILIFMLIFGCSVLTVYYQTTTYGRVLMSLAGVLCMMIFFVHVEIHRIPLVRCMNTKIIFGCGMEGALINKIPNDDATAFKYVVKIRSTRGFEINEYCKENSYKKPKLGNWFVNAMIGGHVTYITNHFIPEGYEYQLKHKSSFENKIFLLYHDCLGNPLKATREQRKAFAELSFWETERADILNQIDALVEENKELRKKVNMTENAKTEELIKLITDAKAIEARRIDYRKDGGESKNEEKGKF